MSAFETAFFHSAQTSESHARCCGYQWHYFFRLVSVIPLCGIPISDHLHCFQFLTIVDRTAINIYVIYMFLCAHDFSFFKGKYIQVGLLGITLPSIYLTFQETENLFSKMAILHPNQRRMRMPVAAHLQQHLLLFCRDIAIVVKVSLMGSYVQFHLALNQKQFTHNP